VMSSRAHIPNRDTVALLPVVSVRSATYLWVNVGHMIRTVHATCLWSKEVILCKVVKENVVRYHQPTSEDKNIVEQQYQR